VFWFVSAIGLETGSGRAGPGRAFQSPGRAGLGLYFSAVYRAGLGRAGLDIFGPCRALPGPHFHMSKDAPDNDFKGLCVNSDLKKNGAELVKPAVKRCTVGEYQLPPASAT